MSSGGNIMITVNTARGQKTEESIFRCKELRVKCWMKYSHKYMWGLDMLITVNTTRDYNYRVHNVAGILINTYMDDLNRSYYCFKSRFLGWIPDQRICVNYTVRVDF